MIIHSESEAYKFQTQRCKNIVVNANLSFFLPNFDIDFGPLP